MSNLKHKNAYRLMMFGAALGMIASFWDTLEYISLLKNSHSALVCNLNSVFSCSSVLRAWQSTVFGFPNSIMCLVFFTLTLGIILSSYYGAQTNKSLRLTMQGFSLFFLGFGAWFLEQSTFVIRALCILCFFCYAGVILINAGWLRINAADLPGHKTLNRWTQSGADIFIWIVWALFISFIILMKFK